MKWLTDKKRRERESWEWELKKKLPGDAYLYIYSWYTFAVEEKRENLSIGRSSVTKTSLTWRKRRSLRVVKGDSFKFPIRLCYFA